MVRPFTSLPQDMINSQQYDVEHTTKKYTTTLKTNENSIIILKAHQTLTSSNITINYIQKPNKQVI